MALSIFWARIWIIQGDQASNHDPARQPRSGPAPQGSSATTRVLDGGCTATRRWVITYRAATKRRRTLWCSLRASLGANYNAVPRAHRLPGKRHPSPSPEAAHHEPPSREGLLDRIPNALVRHRRERMRERERAGVAGQRACGAESASCLDVRARRGGGAGASASRRRRRRERVEAAAHARARRGGGREPWRYAAAAAAGTPPRSLRISTKWHGTLTGRCVYGAVPTSW